MKDRCYLSNDSTSIRQSQIYFILEYQNHRSKNRSKTNEKYNLIHLAGCTQEGVGGIFRCVQSAIMGVGGGGGGYELMEGPLGKFGVKTLLLPLRIDNSRQQVSACFSKTRIT